MLRMGARRDTAGPPPILSPHNQLNWLFAGAGSPIGYELDIALLGWIFPLYQRLSSSILPAGALRKS